MPGVVLVSCVLTLQNERILFIHLSARYNKTTALRLLNDQLPSELKAKCSVFLEGFS